MRVLIIGLFGVALITAAAAQPYGGYPATSTYSPYTNSAMTVVYPAPAPPPVPALVIVKPRQTAYLIAFKDSVIGLADAYWVSGNTFNYVTPDHQMKTALLASIDRAISERLKKRTERIVFFLPPRTAGGSPERR